MSQYKQTVASTTKKNASCLMFVKKCGLTNISPHCAVLAMILFTSSSPWIWQTQVIPIKTILRRLKLWHIRTNLEVLNYNECCDKLVVLTLIGALVVTHAMLRRLTSWRCIIIIIKLTAVLTIILRSQRCYLMTIIQNKNVN